jgi:hypothetical protein
MSRILHEGEGAVTEPMYAGPHGHQVAEHMDEDGHLCSVSVHMCGKVSTTIMM